MKKYQAIIYILTIVFLAIPFLSAAQTTVPVQEDCGLSFIPIPCMTTLGGAPWGVGPASRVTATGLILSIIEIALTITGILAVLFVIIGGFRYVTAHGNEEAAEAAKKTITQALIGVVVVILSFVIIRIISNALLFGGPAT